MFCNKCGNQINNDSTFCCFCGNQIAAARVSPAQTPNGSANIAPNIAVSNISAPVAVDENKSKSKLFLMLTLIFFLIYEAINFIFNRIYNSLIRDFLNDSYEKYRAAYEIFNKMQLSFNIIFGVAIFVFSLLAFIFEMKKKTKFRVLCVLVFVIGCIILISSVLLLSSYFAKSYY